MNLKKGMTIACLGLSIATTPDNAVAKIKDDDVNHIFNEILHKSAMSEIHIMETRSDFEEYCLMNKPDIISNFPRTNRIAIGNSGEIFNGDYNGMSEIDREFVENIGDKIVEVSSNLRIRYYDMLNRYDLCDNEDYSIYGNRRIAKECGMVSVYDNVFFGDYKIIHTIRDSECNGKKVDMLIEAISNYGNYRIHILISDIKTNGSFKSSRAVLQPHDLSDEDKTKIIVMTNDKEFPGRKKVIIGNLEKVKEYIVGLDAMDNNYNGDKDKGVKLTEEHPEKKYKKLPDKKIKEMEDKYDDEFIPNRMFDCLDEEE
jgi:hypothetical protein